MSQRLAYAIPSKAQTGADKARQRFARHLQMPIEANSDRLSYLRLIQDYNILQAIFVIENCLYINENRSTSIHQVF